MSYDLRDGTVHAWAPTNPTPPATTWRQRLTQWIGLDDQAATEHVGADETWTPADELEPGDTGRHHRGNVRPVDRGYRLSPAALQRVTRTVEQVPSSYEDTTGLLNVPNVPEPPQTREEVLAEIRGALTGPTPIADGIAGVATDDEITRWAADGADVDDQTQNGDDQ
ncbi:hypothetical protein AB0B48_09125 [Micromonospora sp. NPDC049089]|uniref:hypothetical protein n=1 Tax=Micromonospora sp. NPDC049089 TaxID=3155496 RepID=UPI0033DEC33E